MVEIRHASTVEEFIKSMEEFNDRYGRIKNDHVIIPVSREEYRRHNGDVNSYLNEKIRGITPKVEEIVDNDYLIRLSITANLK